MTTTLSGVDTNGNVPFTSDAALPPVDGLQAITGEAVWSDSQVTPLPPSYRNDYEVVHRESVKHLIGQVPESGAIAYRIPGYGCWPQWKVMYSTRDMLSTNSYGVPDASGWTTVEAVGWKYREPNGNCTSDPENDPTVWSAWIDGCDPYLSSPPCTESYLVPMRSLAFGTYRSDVYQVYDDGSEWLYPWPETTDASLTFRAPMHYPTNQLVIFTFEGMEYGRPEGATQDLSQVQFIFNGQTNTPVAVSNEIQSVSYLISVDGGGKQYTLTTNSFLWPTITTNYVKTYVPPYNPDWSYTAWHTNTYHTLSWTNFHNGLGVFIIRAVPNIQLNDEDAQNAGTNQLDGFEVQFAPTPSGPTDNIRVAQAVRSNGLTGEPTPKIDTKVPKGTMPIPAYTVTGMLGNHGTLSYLECSVQPSQQVNSCRDDLLF